MFKRIILFGMILSVLLSGVYTRADVLFEAQDPTRVPMPDQADYLSEDGEFDYEAYDKAYMAWLEDDRQKFLSGDESASLTAYAIQAAREILAREDQKNKVFSPVNLYLALSMLSEITGGDTQSEILSLLDAENIETLRRRANAIFLSIYENDGQTTSIPAASIWLRNDISYKPDALEYLCKDYFASSFAGTMGDSEYDREIQSWLNEKTGGLLEEQAKNITFDPDTIISLATSLYFKAGWTGEFSKSNTKTDVFHAVKGDQQAEFMHKGGSDTYYWGENFGAVALAMTNGGKMWFILPDEGISPESLFENEAVLRLTTDPAAWQNQTRLIINKAIPKFDVTGENDLIQSLKNLGVQLAFDPKKSDFTPLTDIPEIAVSKAQHDARVKIDEKGVEAAAYTVIMAYATSARPPEEKMDFIVDRPFAFLITSDDGFPLFTGIVNTIEN